MRIYLLLLALLLMGCSQEISREDAERSAVSFAQNGIKYFTAAGNLTDDVEEPQIEVLAAKHVDGEWRILLKVSAVKEGVIKKQGLRVSMDDKTGKLVTVAQVNRDAVTQ